MVALRLNRLGQEGQGLVEYALIFMLIVIIGIATLVFVGGSLSGMLHAVGASV